MGIARSARGIALAVCLLSAVAAAQDQVTVTDIRGLRDAVFEARTDVARLRTGDGDLMKRLRAELDAIRDRVAQFDERVGRGQAVPRKEYLALRDRIAEVRLLAKSERTVTGAGLGPGASAPDLATIPADRLIVPARTKVDVQLLTAIDPSTLRIDDRVEATTVKPIVVRGRMLLPAGTLVRGVVTSIAQVRERRAGRAFAVRFTQATADFRTHPIDATARVDRALQLGAMLRVQFN